MYVYNNLPKVIPEKIWLQIKQTVWSDLRTDTKWKEEADNGNLWEKIRLGNGKAVNKW